MKKRSLVKYGGGGTKKPEPKRVPIPVSNPNDPKLRAYNDSNDLYRAGAYQRQITHGTPPRPFSELNGWAVGSSEIGNRLNQAVRPGYNSLSAALGIEDPITAREVFMWERKGNNNQEDYQKTKNKKSEADLKMEKYLQNVNNSNIRLVDRQSPEFYHKNILPVGYYHEENDGKLGPTNLLYKPPVQPYVYQKPKSNYKKTITTNIKPSYKEFLKTVNPDFVGNDYNLEEAYNNLPYSQTSAWAKNPNKNHLPDTYKLPNHPTFSNESKYYKEGMPAVRWEGEKAIPINQPAPQPAVTPTVPTYNTPQQMYQGREFMETTGLRPGNYHPEEVQAALANQTAKGKRAFANGGIIQYPDGGTIMKEYKYGGIHIKPENKGKFIATKKATGKSTEELTHSKNPVTRKRAIFAQNAAKWHHADGGLIQYPIGGETVPGTTPVVPPPITPTWDPNSQSMPKYIYNSKIGKDGNTTFEMADQATQAKYNQGLMQPEWFQMGIGERRAAAPTAVIPQPAPAAPMAYNKNEWGRYNNSSVPGQTSGYSYTHYPTGKVYNEADYNAIRNPVAPIAPAALATRANGGYIPSRSLRKFNDGGTWAGVDEQGNPMQTTFNKSTAGSNLATGASIAGAAVPMITSMIPDQTVRDSEGNSVGQKVGTGKAIVNSAASGAAMGASFGGPVGALIGAGAGAIYGGISNSMANNKIDAEMKQANARISNRKLDNRMSTNNNNFATQDYNNNNMVYAEGGMVIDQHMPDPNAELELNETFQEPSGQVGMVDGPSHDNGGVEVNLEEGTRIWSDRLKHNGKTFASLTRPIVNKIEKLEKTSPTDYNSRFKQNSKMLLNKQLDHLFEVQETNKQQDEMKRSLKNGVVNDRGNYHYAVGGVTGDPRNTLTSAGNFNFTPTNSSYGFNAGLNRQFGANRNLNLGLNTNLGLDYTRPMPSQEGSVMVPTVKPNANVSMTGEYNRGNNNFTGNVSYNPYNQGVEGRVAYTRKFSMGGYLPKHWDGNLIGNDPKEQYRLPNGTYNKMQYAADQLNPTTFKNPSQTFNRPEPNPGTYSGVTQYGINPTEFQTYMSKNGMLNGTNRTAPTVEGFNAWKNAPPVTTDDNNVLGNNYNKQNFDPSYNANFDRYNPAPPEQPFIIPDKSFFTTFPNTTQQIPVSASNNNQQPPLYTVDQPGTQTNFAEEGMKDKTAPATKKSNWFKDNANTLGQIGSIAGTLGLQNRNLNRLPAPRTIADVNFQNQIANPKYMDLSAERASINRTGMSAMDEAQRQFGSSAAAQAFKNKARLNQLEGTGKSYQTQENANTGIYNEFAGMKGEAGIKQAMANNEIARLNAENWYSDKAMRTANKNAAIATAGHGVGEIFGNKAKYANELDKAGMLANQFDPSVLSSIANNNPELADKFMKEGRFTAAQWKAATGKDWVEKKAYGGTIKKRTLKK